MIQRTITDITTGASLASSYFWFEYVIHGAQGLMVLGGLTIMAMRLWLIWKDVQDRRKKDGNS